MTNELSTNAKVEVCRGDFYLMLQNAMLQAGGNSNIDKLKLMSLSEVVNLLAQNGIRMVYMPDRHMDAVKVTWEAQEKNPCRDVEPKLKKQVLCEYKSRWPMIDPADTDQ